MPSWIVKLAEDEYVEWSTIVDAPTSYIKGRERAEADWGADRVERADAHVTSCIEPDYWYDTVEPVIAGNRAGEGESELTLAQIREEYQR